MDMKAKNFGKAGDVVADYWKHTKKYPFLVGSLVVVGMMLQATIVIAPLYLKQFVDIIASVPVSSAGPQLFTILVFFALFSFLAWGLRRIQFYAASVLETRVMTDLSITSFDYIIRHSYHFFVSNFVGSLARRVTRYSRSYETVMDAILFQLYPLALLSLGIIFILYLRNPMLGLGL